MQVPRSNRQPSFGKSIFTKAVLLDTGALIALANSKDLHHQSATECLETLTSNQLPLFIAIPTIYETHKRLLFDLGPKAASKFLLYIFDGSIHIERTVHDDEVKAKYLTEKYSSLKLTLTDAANMAVMLRLGIAKVFSFDKHFLQVGFIRIPPYY